jgi:hypothetical protein
MDDDPLEEVDQVAGEVFDRLRADLMGGDGYLSVLLLTLVTVVVIPIDENFRGGGVATATVLGLLVLVTMTRSKVSNLLRRISVVVVAASVLLAMYVTVRYPQGLASNQAISEKWLAALAAGSYTLILALCFPAILRRALSHRRVSLNTVAASLAAYLVIGLIFASMFRVVHILAPPFFTQSPTTGFTYEYFSYVSLTTVGYGDYTPANDAGRTLAMLEALMGQVFLVTIVALVVSNLGQARTTLRDSTGGDGIGRPPPVSPPSG